MRRCVPDGRRTWHRPAVDARQAPIRNQVQSGKISSRIMRWPVSLRCAPWPRPFTSPRVRYEQSTEVLLAQTSFGCDTAFGLGSIFTGRPDAANDTNQDWVFGPGSFANNQG